VFRGPEPQVRWSSDRETLARYAVTWIQHLLDQGKLGSHEICVTPNVGFIRTALESAGIGTLELKPRQADPGQSEPGVRLGSMQRIKGLEFRAVLMVLDQPQENSSDVRHRFEKYVAATRAREHLMVLVRGSDAGAG
jgi:superfamily I DNA/RNA helicase